MSNPSSTSQNQEAFTKMFIDVKMPKVDFEAAMKIHKKNLETLSKTQRSWFDCAKNLNEANTNYFKHSFDAMRAHWQDMLSSKSLEDKMQSHTERLKDFFEKSMNHGRSVSDQLLRSHHEVSSNIQDRFTESVHETSDIVKKTVNSK